MPNEIAYFKRWLSMLRRSSEADPSAGDLLSYVGNNQVQWVASSGVGVTDHGGLTGLSDDDHTQYPLLLGRAGGQTLYGGTVAADDLKLQGSFTIGAGDSRVNIGTANTIFVSEDNDYFEFTEGTQDKCRVYNSAAFTHNSTGNFLSITFDSERFDGNTMHSTSSNTERITCTRAGYYLVGGSVSWVSNATGLRILSILHSTSAPVTTEIARVQTANTAGAGTHGQTIMSLWNAAATDWFELQVYQDSGGNLNVNGAASYSPEFWAVKVA